MIVGLSAALGAGLLWGLVFLTPFLTVLQNTEPMIDGRAFLPGLQLYDGFSMLSSIFVNLIPLWLGLRYLNTREGHKALLEAIVISGVLYTFPALLENADVLSVGLSLVDW